MKYKLIVFIALVTIRPLSLAGQHLVTRIDSSLSRHPFVLIGEWDYRKPMQTIFVIKNGRVDWTYGVPINDKNNVLQELGDVHMLANGNIVFSYKTGAGEVNKRGKLVWNYLAPKDCEVHTSQPIGKRKVLIMQNGSPAKAMFIDKKSGKVEKEVILETGNQQFAHGQFRRIRYTKSNTLLVAHMDMNKVVEYDLEGKELWSVKAQHPWGAVRLKNGNTLIGGDNFGYAREVNSKGEIVWELTQKDVPSILIGNIHEVSRLENGNTVICNWIPHKIKSPKDWVNSVQVFEVTPDKKVVWVLKQWNNPDLGTASAIQLLDEKGKAENGDLQR